MEIIKILKDTPVPSLLILAGLFILILAFVTKIGGVIEVSSDQRRWAIPTGLFVLVIGLILNFYSVYPSEQGAKTSPESVINDVFDPTKPFLIQLGSDTDPVSAGDEIDRVRDLAKEKKLSIVPFKKGKWYVTTVGFFESKSEADTFRDLIVVEIPFFKSTNPQVQNIREWCPNHNKTGIYLKCQN